MRKFKRIKAFTGFPYESDVIYYENTVIGNHISVGESAEQLPDRWEEVFDKPKLFKLL